MPRDAAQRRYGHRHFLVIATDPPVIYLQDWLLNARRLSGFRMLLGALRGRRAYLLVHPSWSHEEEGVAQGAVQRIERHRRRYPNHRIVYLANTPAEEERFRELGIRTVFSNHCSLLDPTIFVPLPDVEKSFRAIYDAAFITYKRHELAIRIRDLALVAYVKPDTTDEEIWRIKGILPHAVWLKDGSARDAGWLTDQEVNGFLNRARVGLCLSATEGAMFASAQYLLAGLPVVTTRSRGGRDTFFDPDYVRWVEDDADAVAEGVDQLCADPPDPWEIRRRTLARFAEHRARFVELVNAIYREEGRAGVWADRWPEGLPHKLHGFHVPLRAQMIALLARRKVLPWVSGP
jgi:glycosyltransferase involved in cell wall biosynthesis